MCANYQPTPPDKLLNYFGIEFTGQYELESYPGYFSPIIRAHPSNDLTLDVKECLTACFGIMPPWTDKLNAYVGKYNAKSETIATKHSYRTPWKKRQFCIVPASAIYEPRYDSQSLEPLELDLLGDPIIQPVGKSVRWRISHGTGAPLGIAGIWEWRLDKEGNDLFSFSMITINADDHPLMRQFHEPGKEKRMVVILDPSQYEEWLHTPLEHARSFLTQYPAEKLVAEPAPLPPRKKKTEDIAK